MTQLINMATRNKLVETSLSNLQMSIYINQKAGLHTQSLHWRWVPILSSGSVSRTQSCPPVGSIGSASCALEIWAQNMWVSVSVTIAAFTHPRMFTSEQTVHDPPQNLIFKIKPRTSSACATPHNSEQMPPAVSILSWGVLNVLNQKHNLISNYHNLIHEL